jgi:hypothetical protein
VFTSAKDLVSVHPRNPADLQPAQDAALGLRIEQAVKHHDPQQALASDQALSAAQRAPEEITR